jgi:hypothetical protein
MSRIQLLRRRPNVAVCSAMDDTQKQFRILWHSWQHATRTNYRYQHK